MPGKGLKRKLVAILSADVVAYSRLMRDDEEETVHQLGVYRKILIKIINQYGGSVIDFPGDNLLAEFDSVVDAVKGAVEIQTEVKRRNADIPLERRMKFRIGINLGDVLHENERIYGDGVNIASRLEGLATAGGISISGTVYEHIKNKLHLGYEYTGEQKVKNISEPVRVYRIITDTDTVGKLMDKKRPGKRRRQWAITAVLILSAGAALTAIWMHVRPDNFDKDGAEITAVAPQLSERASIAVLPFKNLSGDPEQEYFSDGITNDIITDLSKFRELLVIASNTVFTYKGLPVNVRDVSRELGVRYVIEGSVQKTDYRVRLNVQLIDGGTGHHLWAERYERPMKELFAVQDKILKTIVATLAVRIDSEERARVLRKDTVNLKAYDLVLRGWDYSTQTKRSPNMEARQLFEKAIELDPLYATAYVGLGRTYLNSFLYGWTEFPDQTLDKAFTYGQKALGLDETNASARALIGIIYRYRLQHDLAIKELERAVELNPNDAHVSAYLGTVLNYIGRPDDAIRSLNIALRLDPKMVPAFHMHLGLAYYLKGQYDQSISTLNRGLLWYSDHVFIHIPLAAAYAQAGRLEDAQNSAATVLRLHPFFEVDYYGTAFVNPADRSHLAEGLRKAGLK